MRIPGYAIDKDSSSSSSSSDHGERVGLSVRQLQVSSLVLKVATRMSRRSMYRLYSWRFVPLTVLQV